MIWVALAVSLLLLLASVHRLVRLARRVSFVDGSEMPVTRLARALMLDAYAKGASAIHVERHGDLVLVRFRIDGRLVECLKLPLEALDPLVASFEEMATPEPGRGPLEEGRIELRRFVPDGPELTLHLAVLPMLGGKRAVLRLLLGSSSSIPLDLEILGVAPAHREALRRQLARRDGGVVLVAAPPASGAPTFLQALAHELERLERSRVIVGAEAWCVSGLAGMVAPGVSAGVILARGAALDLDAIVVGALRDRETTEAAFQAAQDGRLVVSSVVAGDAAEAVASLSQELGVNPLRVAKTLRLVLAQRLARRTCTACKGAPGSACERCRGTGQRGRVAFNELVVVDPALADVVRGGPLPQALRAAIAASGVATMRQDALAKVDQGLVTRAEAEAVLG